MSQSPMQFRDSTEDGVKKLVESAWQDGRPIVPLLGAGISVDSGMPALSSIIRYLAKVSLYLRHELYVPRGMATELFPEAARLLKDRMDLFVTDFGWPDRFQLNADVRDGLDRNDEWQRDFRGNWKDWSFIEAAIRKELDAFARRINPGGSRKIEEHLRTLLAERAEFDDEFRTLLEESRNRLNGAARGTRAVSRIPPEVKSVLSKIERIEKQRSDAHLQNLQHKEVNSFIYQVAGDWKPLLREVSAFRPELVDALFSRLARNRRPGLTQLFLVHLARLLRVSRILTFNFDPLIEDALVQEQLAHRVLSMEHGQQLPKMAHLDELLSVIKMHGSTHNILVDERVDYRISDVYRRAFLDLMGRRPLLIVAGCSGNDRRLRELIQAVLDNDSESQVLWFYRAENADLPPDFLEFNKDERLHVFPTHDLGQSFRYLYTQLTGRLPATMGSYSAHVHMPLFQNPGSPSNADWSLAKRRAALIAPYDHRCTAGCALIHLVTRIPLGYIRIWIDLEEHYSLGQVVAAIIDQVRLGDSLLNPFVASVAVNGDDESGLSPEDAAKRVARALRRSRYALILSNLDAFPWQPTTHHGTTSGDDQDILPKLEALERFLLELLSLQSTGRNETVPKWADGDSILIFHYEHSYQRHPGDKSEEQQAERARQRFEKLISRLRDRLPTTVAASGEPKAAERIRDRIQVEAPGSSTSFQKQSARGDLLWRPASTIEPDSAATALALAAIASHRRTRLDVGLRHLLDDLGLAKAADFDPLIAKLAEQKVGLRPTEGGGWWFDRPNRDAVYQFNTRSTNNKTIEDLLVLLRKKSIPKDTAFGNTFFQLSIAATLHDKIARNYYLNLYLPSKDSFTFLEYVYHRISTLRYLRNLCRLVSGLQPGHKEIEFEVGDRHFDQLMTVGQKESGPLSFGQRWKDLWPLPAQSGKAGSVKIQISKWLQTAHALRENRLQGFSEMWGRSEAALRRTIPAEQLVSWCRRLLDYDLKSRIFLEPDAPGPSALRQQLTEKVKVTLTKALYERADFDGMKRLSEVEPVGPHERIDANIAEHWKAFSVAHADTATGPDMKNLADLKSHRESEVKLRVTYQEIEFALAPFAATGRLSVRTDIENGLSELKTLKQKAIAAIEVAREEPSMPPGSGLRNPLLEQSFPPGLFIPYRALFQMLLGRIGMFQGSAESHLPGGDYHSSFRFAYRDLSYARNGIGRENAAFVGLLDLCCGEVSLAHVDAKYREGQRGSIPSDLRAGGQKPALTRNDPERFLQSVRGKLRTCAGYLGGCVQNLLDGPRYVLIWRFLHAAQARYQIERILEDLFLSAVTSQDPQDHKRSAGDLVRRTRQALTAIRAGLDCTTARTQRFRDHYFHLWVQLAIAAFLSGTARIAMARARVPWQDQFEVGLKSRRALADTVTEAWQEMNRSEMIEWTASKETLSKLNRFVVGPLFRKYFVLLREPTDVRQLAEVRNWVLNDGARELCSTCLEEKAAATVPIQ